MAKEEKVDSEEKQKRGKIFYLFFANVWSCLFSFVCFILFYFLFFPEARIKQTRINYGKGCCCWCSLPQLNTGDHLVYNATEHWQIHFTGWEDCVCVCVCMTECMRVCVRVCDILVLLPHHLGSYMLSSEDLSPFLEGGCCCWMAEDSPYIIA